MEREEDKLGWRFKRRLASETIETLINQRETIGASVQQVLDAGKRQKAEKVLERDATNINQVIQTSATYHDDFQFPPLPRPSSIRLLTIEPGPSSEPVRCRLDAADLEDKPAYRTLSYCWEQGKSLSSSFSKDAFSPEKTFLSPSRVSSFTGGGSEWLTEADETPRVIMCNSKVIKIKPNLYNALVHLRDQSEPLVFWIDALCIKQDDLNEKNIQIPLMGRIYSSALSVEVWLGKCPPAISPVIREMYTSRLSDSERTMAQKHSVGYFVIFYLFTRRWFSRIWVLQETCFAQNLNFHFGEHQWDPETLTALLRILGKDRLDRFAAIGASNMKQLVPTMELRKSILQGSRLDIMQWLQTCKGRKSTDPRDLLFGGMALINPDSLMIDQSIQLPDEGIQPDDEDSSASKLRLWPRITVRSRASVPEVLLNLAACCLSQPGGIQMLSLASRTRFDEKSDEYQDPLDGLKTKGPLPSWIPNLSARTSQIGDTFHNQGLRSFKACNGLSQRPRISADGSSLFLEAAPLGTIQRAGHEEWMKFNRAWGGGMEAVMLHDRHMPYGFLEFLLSLPTDRPEGELFDALARVMTAEAATEADMGPYPPSLVLRAALCMIIHNEVLDTVENLVERKKEGESPVNDSAVSGWISSQLKKLDESHTSLRQISNIIDYTNDASDVMSQWDYTEFHYQAKEVERFAEVKRRFPDEPWPDSPAWEQLPWIKEKKEKKKKGQQQADDGKRTSNPTKTYSFPWKKDGGGPDGAGSESPKLGGMMGNHSFTWNTTFRNRSPDKLDKPTKSYSFPWSSSSPTTTTTPTAEESNPEEEEKNEEEPKDPTDKIIEIFYKITGFRNIYNLVPSPSTPSSTSTSTLLLAPYWTESSDVLMLVKGSPVPYIFTPLEESLRRKISRIRTQKLGVTDAMLFKGNVGEETRRKIREGLEEEVRGLEERLRGIISEQEEGREDGDGGNDAERKRGKGKGRKWVLVGEAYVEGVMHGEGEEEEQGRMFEVLEVV